VVESGGLIQVISVDIVVDRYIHLISDIGGRFVFVVEHKGRGGV
jgi:hypothetical protein